MNGKNVQELRIQNYNAVSRLLAVLETEAKGCLTLEGIRQKNRELAVNLEIAKLKHPKWKGIKIVNRILYDNKDRGTAILIKELKAASEEIRSKDKILGTLIDRALFIDEDELLILNELLNKLKEGKAEELLNYLMREYRGDGGIEPLPQRLARFRDKKLAEDIYKILENAIFLEEKLRGRIGFLHNFLNRLDSLGKEVGSLNNYIEEFKRLIQNLRAADHKSGLADKIEASSIIKQLLNYYGEIKKLEEYLGLVERGMRESSWEEFLKVFYPKLDAEEEIIRDTYGDPQAANAMELTRKRYSQYPVAWQRLFQDILARRRSEAHIRGLMALCYKKINELINEEIGRIGGVVHKRLTVQLMKIEGRIKARIKEFKDVKGNLKSILRKRKKDLEREFKVTKKGFIRLENNLADHYTGSLESYKEIFTIINAYKIMDQIKEYNARKLKWLEYLNSNLGAIRPNDVRTFQYMTNTLAATAILERTEAALQTKVENGIEISKKIVDKLDDISMLFDTAKALLLNMMVFLIQNNFPLNNVEKASIVNMVNAGKIAISQKATAIAKPTIRQPITRMALRR